MIDSLRASWKYVLVTAIVVIGVGVGVAYLTAKSNWNGVISAFDWRREWDKQQYMMIGGSCWFLNCQPERAYNISTRSEVHHHNRVKTGENCRTDSDGDRSCTPVYMSIPVYETRVYYTVNDWRFSQTIASTGQTNKVADLYWPDLNLHSCPDMGLGMGMDDPLLGCERPAVQREFFYVSVVPDNHDVLPGHCPVNFVSWGDMVIGQAVHGSYWYHQNIVDCADLHW